MVNEHESRAVGLRVTMTTDDVSCLTEAYDLITNLFDEEGDLLSEEDASNYGHIITSLSGIIDRAENVFMGVRDE